MHVCMCLWLPKDTIKCLAPLELEFQAVVSC